jgi:hypothetical protein
VATEFKYIVLFNHTTSADQDQPTLPCMISGAYNYVSDQFLKFEKFKKKWVLLT